MLEAFDDLEDYLPSTYDQGFGEYIEAGKSLARELGFEPVKALGDDLRPPEHTLICEGENGYLIFEEDYPFERSEGFYVEEFEPLLPEELRFRNSHLELKNGERFPAEGLDYTDVKVERKIKNVSEAEEFVILSSLKDFNNSDKKHKR